MNGKKQVLTKAELKKYKEVLLATQSKILGDIDHLQDTHLNSHKDNSGDLSGYSLHMADVGTDNYDRELALDVVGNEQETLYQIQKALERIDLGTFGLCEMEGRPIDKRRLDAIPWTPFCKEAAEKLEKGKRGRI